MLKKRPLYRIKETLSRMPSGAWESVYVIEKRILYFLYAEDNIYRKFFTNKESAIAYIDRLTGKNIKVVYHNYE